MKANDVDPGCFWHGEEPIPEGAYRVCGECYHCWPTTEDLMADVRKTCAEIGLTVPAGPNEVYCCPLCAHDF